MQKKLQLFDHIRRGRKWQAWTSTDWTMTDRFCPLQVGLQAYSHPVLVAYTKGVYMF